MNFRKYAGIILNILVPLLTVYLVCVWGLRLVVFFLPFVIGWIVAAIANPVVRFFEKRLKIVRRHGSMVLIAGVLALVIFGIYAARHFPNLLYDVLWHGSSRCCAG